MVAKIHYRWDFIGLSTDTKPTPADSPKVVNGSTFYCSDNSKLYVFYKDQWYERKALGGGSSVNVVQTTGTSTTDVMSQNAVTSMVFNDPSTQSKIKIGAGTPSDVGYDGIEIGHYAHADGIDGVAIGASARAAGLNSVAIGAFSGGTSTQGVVSFGGATLEGVGYNNSRYRLLTNIYDGQSDHDAATVGQLKMGTLSATPTGTTAGMPGRLYTLDTGGGSYEVYLCVHDNGDDTYVWKQLSLI